MPTTARQDMASDRGGHKYSNGMFVACGYGTGHGAFSIRFVGGPRAVGMCFWSTDFRSACGRRWWGVEG